MQSTRSFGTDGFQSTVASSVDRSPIAPRSMNSRRLLASRRYERPQPLSRKDFDELLARAKTQAADSDLIDIATIIFFTGLRAKEVALLRWKDIDFKNRSMFIASGKSGQERKVPFAGRILKILKGRKAHQRKTEPVFGRHAQRTLSRASQQLSALSLSVRRSPISLHVLRESFMVSWVKAGGNLVPLAYITRGATIIRNVSKEMSFDHLYAEAAEFQARLEEAETESFTPHGESIAVETTPSSVEVPRGFNK